MAMQIVKRELSTPTRKGGPRKEAGYLAFIHALPCVVTGVHGVEAAHLSYASPKHGHYGRGKSQKAPDRWALPLCPDQHREQHAGGEANYWRNIVNRDPHLIALVIYGLWNEHGADAEPFATAIIMQNLPNQRN